jgi:hypothetical protein
LHLLIAITDHFEPDAEGATPQQAAERVDRWVRQYPRLFGEFRDSDGRPPRHTFFYPMEEYDGGHVDALAGLCREGFGEVEVHLHHEGETAAELGDMLRRYRDILADRHGLLARDLTTGEPRYGFIHGNWALDNSHPDGRWCGVNCELDVLRKTGCYADFTLPSAPQPTQTRTINSIYYALDDPDRPKSHDVGLEVGTGPPPDRGLMLIQGPLVLDWRRRRHGVMPRVENGCVQPGQEAHIDRLDAWLRANVHVATRPDWVFVKLHAHGATEFNQRSLLGPSMVEFHRALAAKAGSDPSFHYHYVTAREMYNLALAAASAWIGSVEAARNFALTWAGGQPNFTHTCEALIADA